MDGKNKGFSLVELIVVVLIMAIIAVALAPQILKWVDNSRVSADIQTKDILVDFMQLTVMTDEVVNELVRTDGAWLKATNSGVELKKGSDGSGANYGTADKLYEKFCQYAGTNNLNEFKTKKKNTEILITVDDVAATITSRYYDKNNSSVDLVVDD